MTFAELTAKLYPEILRMGFRFTYGEVMRDARIAALNAKEGKGITNSLHTISLAVDLHLFSNGVYLKSSDAYRGVGTFWKSLHELARWGGDFHENPDGNHFSLEFNGIK